MASIFQGIFEESVGPAASELFGETVAQWPLGVEADSVDIAGAIWNEDDSHEIRSRGKEGNRTGTLIVADSLTVDNRDIWIIRNEGWQTISWERDPAGNKEVHVKRSEIEKIQRPGHMIGGMQ